MTIETGSGHLGDLMSGLIDGELTFEEEQLALDHVMECPACAAESLGLGQARAWVRALPPVDAPSGFYQAVLSDRLPDHPRSDHRLRATAFAERALADQPFLAPPPFAWRAQLRRRVGLVAVGAAAAAVTALGVGSPRQSPVPPSAPRLVQARTTNASVGADILTKLAPMGIPVSPGR